MRRTLVTLLAVLLLLSTAARAADPSLVLVGTVARPAGGGTQCEIRAELSSGKLVDVDLTASGLKLKDDKGTDLGAKAAGALSDYATQPWYAAMRALPGGRTVLLTARTPKAAAGNASSLSVEGTLRVTYSLLSQKGEAQLTLTEGSACELAGLKGTVVGLGRDERASEFSVRLAGAHSLHFDALTLRGEDGGEVPCSASVSRAPGAAGSGDLLIRFRGVRGSPAKLKLTWLAWADLRRADLDFALTVPMEGSDVKAQSLRLALSGGSTGTGSRGPTEPAAEPSTEPDPDEPDVKPVGEYGIKIAAQIPADRSPVVFVTKPPASRSSVHHIVSLVPAASKDTSWGYWQMLKSGKRKYTLRRPLGTGRYELRVGRIKYPAKVYEVVERIKVSVR